MVRRQWTPPSVGGGGAPAPGPEPEPEAGPQERLILRSQVKTMRPPALQLIANFTLTDRRRSQEIVGGPTGGMIDRLRARCDHQKATLSMLRVSPQSIHPRGWICMSF